MRVIKPDSKEFLKRPCGIGLGNFDGIHIGHMMLVETLVHECQIEGISSVLYTFEAHPENILRKKLICHNITVNEKKIGLLKAAGLDAVFFEYFDEDFSRLPPEDFICDILVNKFGIKLAVVGENYRFGYRGDGDVELLKEYGCKYGFRVRVLPIMRLGEEIVSSTNIRKYIMRGDMRHAADMLGRYFSIEGKVKEGMHRGRTMGFPTANIYPENWMALPKAGVYITKLRYNGRYYNSITNVGYNPTFGDQNVVTIETNIFDFSEDIYERDVEVFFIEKIRGEKKYNSVDELIKQIRIDIEQAKNFLVLFNGC